MTGWELFGWGVFAVSLGLLLTAASWRLDTWLRKVLITAQHNRQIRRMVRAEEALFLPFADTGLQLDARTPLHDAVVVDLATRRTRPRPTAGGAA